MTQKATLHQQWLLTSPQSPQEQKRETTLSCFLLQEHTGGGPRTLIRFGLLGMVTAASKTAQPHSGRESPWSRADIGHSQTHRCQEHCQQLGLVGHYCHPSMRKLRQENQKFNATFGFIVSSKPPGAMKTCEKQGRTPPSFQRFLEGVRPFWQSPGSWLGDRGSGIPASLWQIPHIQWGKHWML